MRLHMLWTAFQQISLVPTVNFRHVLWCRVVIWPQLTSPVSPLSSSRFRSIHHAVIRVSDPYWLAVMNRLSGAHSLQMKRQHWFLAAARSYPPSPTPPSVDPPIDRCGDWNTPIILEATFSRIDTACIFYFSDRSLGWSFRWHKRIYARLVVSDVLLRVFVIVISPLNSSCWVRFEHAVCYLEIIEHGLDCL